MVVLKTGSEEYCVGAKPAVITEVQWLQPYCAVLRRFGK